MVEQRDGNEERELRRDGPASQAREAMLSVAAQLGMSNRPLHDVLVAMTERLQERDHLHQVVADIAEAGGVDRQAPVRDLTNRVREMSGQAPMPAQLAQIVGVDPATPARETLQRIRQVIADREDLANAMADLKDALGVPLEATQGTLFDRIRRVLERAGGNDREDGEIRQALGVPREMPHQHVVGRIGELRLHTKAADLLADRLDMDRKTGLTQLLEAVTSLRIAADVVKEMDGGTETLTVAEVERQRETRLGALTKTLELWRAHQMGDVPGVEDLVAMAEWLVSGDTGPAAAANDAMVRRGLEHQRQQGGSVDGARWTPGDHVG